MKQKKIHKQKKIWSFSERGLSLVEVMIATMLATVVAMLAMAAILFMSQRTLLVKAAGEQDADTRILASTLHRYFASAIDVEWTKSAIKSITPNAPGKIRERNFTLGFTPTSAPIPQTVAVFLREAGEPGSGTPIGDIRATAIYYLAPTPKTTGQVLISSSQAGTGEVTLSSDDAALRFENIVEFEVAPAGHTLPAAASPFPARVRTLMVRFVTRKFLDLDKSQWRFCPQAVMKTLAACQSSARYKDSERTLFIALSNNSILTDQFAITTDPANPTGFTADRIEEALHGSLYFYRLNLKGE